MSRLKDALLAIHELTSSHLTWRRLQTRLVQESVACRENPGRAEETDHPVVARSPLPRDFRGFRMPRESSCRASAMGEQSVCTIKGYWGSSRTQGGRLERLPGGQVATRFEWAFFGTVEKD